MTLSAYPEYISSVGGLAPERPAHWPATRMRYVTSLNPPPPRMLDGELEVSFFPMEAVGDDGTLDPTRTVEIAAASASYSYFGEGDVAIAKVTPCFENGKGAVMRQLVNGHAFGSSELANLRPGEGIYADFLYVLSTSQPFRTGGAATMTGAGGLRRVSNDYFRNLEFGLPPETEQATIVRFLDRETARIDTLIAKQERLIELLQEKRQALITRAVTKGLDPTVPMKGSGIEWLGEVPAHWQVLPLKHLVNFKSGGTPSKDNLDYWDGDVPWASAKDLKVDALSDTIDHLSREAINAGVASLVEAGSVLVVVRGMILARTFPVTVAAVPMAINQDLKALVSGSRIDSSFLAWALRASMIESMRRTEEAGHGTKALRMGAWSSMPLPVPPIDEQRRVVDAVISRLAELDLLLEKARKSVELSKEHRAALISAAVTGKIDVRKTA